MFPLKDFKKTALIHRGKEISYGELIENAKSFASLLDILPGDRVVIFSENRPEWIYALFGTWMKGGTAVPVDFMSSAEDLAYIVKDAEPKILICSEETSKTLKDLSLHPIEVINLDKITLPSPLEKTLHREKEDLALILYTSGTTGSPKGVMLTFENLMSNVEGLKEARVATQEDSTLAILPFHHSYPLMVTVLVPLSIGATVVFLDELSAEDILRKLQTYRITILVGVPRLYALFHKRIMEKVNQNPFAKALFKASSLVPWEKTRKLIFKRVHDTFGGNIRLMVSGGAKLPEEIIKDFNRMGFKVLEGYGLTETSPIVSFNPPDRIKVGSVGLPIKGVQVRISQEGEILVKGPNVMKGYWRKEEETKKVLKNGWLHTGDLGEMDEEGYLYVKGRLKEIIVLPNGKNVNPEEIEALILKESDLIKECAVTLRNGKLVALVHPDWEKVKERKILNIGETIKWEVIDKVNRRLPPWKRIGDFRLIKEELPKTRLGKIRRFMLNDLFERAQKLQRESHPAPKGEPLVEFLSQETGRNVGYADHIELDLGLDSLGKLELISFIEKTYGVKISEEELASHPTVGELIDLIKSKGTFGETFKEEDFAIPHHPNLLKFGTSLCKIFFKLYNGLEVKGVENLPQKPFLITPNHASYLDGFLIASSLPSEVLKDTYFVGEEVYFRRFPANLFARLFHVIPVNVNKDLKGSIEKVSRLLREGKVVVIFPEGARTRTGELMEFKKGTIMIMKQNRVPAVPTAIVGSYSAMSIYDKFPKPEKIKVIFGKPFTWEGDLQEGANVLREEVRKLLIS